MNELQQLQYDFEMACGPDPTNLQRQVMRKLDELSRVRDMMRLVTGRADWQRMTVSDCEAHAAAPIRLVEAQDLLRAVDKDVRRNVISQQWLNDVGRFLAQSQPQTTATDERQI